MLRHPIVLLVVVCLSTTGCEPSPSGSGDTPSMSGGAMSGGTMSPDPAPEPNPDPMPMGGTQEPDPDPDPGPVEITDVLSRLANDLMRPTFVRFSQQSTTLEGAVGEWAAAPMDSTLRDAAKAAWLDAILTWQHAELMQVGPAGADGKRVGGADLRDRIYSWPSTRKCRIDQALLASEFTEEGWLDGALFEVQGLDALEYLLFFEGSENACPNAVRINRDGLWAEEFEAPMALTSRRAAFSSVLASGVREAADELVTAFSADGGNFAAHLGAATDPYQGPANGLNEVYAALFYIDKVMKDAKLGRPLGIAEGCDDDRCPLAFESLTSGRGAAHLLANLESFEAMFFGNVDGQEGAGFDDLLVARDAAAVASRIAENLTTARTAVTALSPDLATSLADDPAAVEAAHTAIRNVTNDFKGDVVTILDLEVPLEGAGDSD